MPEDTKSLRAAPGATCCPRFPQIAAYAASKGALAQLTRVLALEAIDHGVRVNAVGSGDVVTNLLNDIRPSPQPTS